MRVDFSPLEGIDFNSQDNIYALDDKVYDTKHRAHNFEHIEDHKSSQINSKMFCGFCISINYHQYEEIMS